MPETTSAQARYPSLDGRPVLISGGATGIGEALVRGFAAQGAKVGFVDIAGAEGEALAEELSAAGATVAFRRCDITDTADYRAAIAGFATAHGPALALINNAANDQRHDWRELTPEQFDNRVGVNLKHMFFAIQAVAPAMIAAGRGSIVNFGSIGWKILSGGYPAYAASKAAVHGLTRSFARDLGRDGVRVNTLVPGWVMTKRQLDLWVDDEANALIDRSQCMAGRVLPHHIAAMAMFLASDDAAMCSGQEFTVDGGWS